MKYEELIDFTQKILEANYLPVYRFELPCEDLDHLDQGLRRHILGVKNTSRFFNDLFEKLKPGKIYFNTDLFQCTFVFLLLPAQKQYFTAVLSYLKRYRETALKNCFQASFERYLS